MAGLDSSGFTPKTLTEIQNELRVELAENLADLGETVNTDPSSRFGQLIDIFSSQLSESWDALQDVYNSYFPLTTTGTSLDEANSLTNTPRLGAKSSAAGVYLVGDSGTAVPQGSRISVVNTTNDFLLSSKTTSGTIDPSDYLIGTDSSALIFPELANAGTCELGYDGNFAVLDFNFDDTPAQIKANLETLDPGLEVNVVGGFDGVALGTLQGEAFLHIEVVTTPYTSNLIEIQNSSIRKEQALSLTKDYDNNITTELTYTDLAVSGTVDLGFDGNYATVTWSDSEASIKAALEALANVTTVTVVGRFSTTTAMTIAVDAGTLSSNELLIQNNLLKSGPDLLEAINFVTDTPANTLSAETGEIVSAIGTLITLKDSVSGWDAAYNPLQAIIGRDKETDAEYRLRRHQELSKSGTATAPGIREAVIDAINADVFNVSLVENDTDLYVPGAVAPNEMPPHSFEIFVNALNDASTNDAIGQAIYDSKAVGIKPVSTDGGGRTGDVTDVNDDLITVPFSSTQSVLITVQCNITTDPDTFPSDGVQQIEDNLTFFFTSFEIGETVINHSLYTPVNTVPGILTLEILMKRDADPLAQDNIPMAAFETATANQGSISVVIS